MAAFGPSQDVRKRIKDLTARGGKLVVIDPRKTETAELASEHHFIRPGTDAAFLLGLIHVLFRDNLVELGKLAGVVDGIAEVREAVSALDPEWAGCRHRNRGARYHSHCT
jgi:anaerobic selenocysteine-containing dehydrogenase